jgi:hypothetical protein
MKKTTTIVFGVMLTALALRPAAAIEEFSATLTGAEAGTPSPATGTATLTLNNTETQIIYSISYSGLTSPEIAAHIHRSAGGIAFPLPLGTPKTGTWDSPPASDIELLRNGGLYINIHTQAYASGEIKGTLMRSATPVEPSTWGRIKSLYR